MIDLILIVQLCAFLHLEHADKQSGIPLHVRGDVTGRVPDVSKAQFAKLLKLVGSKLRFNPKWDVQ